MDKSLLVVPCFDNPHICATEKEKNVVLSIKVQPEEGLEGGTTTSAGIDFCIVLDTSGSMTERISDDKSSERKRDLAIKATKNLYDFIRPNDTVSMIFYDSFSRTILDHEKNISRAMFDEKVEESRCYSGGTNITNALMAATELMTKKLSPNMKKVIFLTDGKTVDDTEADAIKAAILLAEKKISITTLGIGKDFNFNFILELVKPCKGTSDSIEKEEEAIQVFEKTLKRSQNIVLKDVELELNVSNEVRVNEYFRSVPQTTYMGKVPLKSDRKFVIRLDDIEKNRYYEYLFEITIPTPNKEYEGKFRVAKSVLKYTVVSTNQPVEKSCDILIDITKDEELAEKEYSTIKTTYKRCIIQKLDNQLNDFLANKDHSNVIRILKELISKTQEIDENERSDYYKSMYEEYITTNQISQQKLNSATKSSTIINGDGLINENQQEPPDIF